jgi:hypothetical protein
MEQTLTSIHKTFGQQMLPPLEPVNDTYKPLNEKSTLPGKERQALDMVQFPCAEYSIWNQL